MPCTPVLTKFTSTYIRLSGAKELDAGAVAKMDYSIDRLCEEVGLLVSQK